MNLLFYGKNISEITHVAIALDYDQIIESGGEGRIETNDGFVRIRPRSHRKDMVAAIKLTNL